MNQWRHIEGRPCASQPGSTNPAEIALLAALLADEDELRLGLSRAHELLQACGSLHNLISAPEAAVSALFSRDPSMVRILATARRALDTLRARILVTDLAQYASNAYAVPVRREYRALLLNDGCLIEDVSLNQPVNAQALARLLVKFCLSRAVSSVALLFVEPKRNMNAEVFGDVVLYTKQSLRRLQVHLVAAAIVSSSGVVDIEVQRERWGSADSG